MPPPVEGRRSIWQTSKTGLLFLGQGVLAEVTLSFTRGSSKQLLGDKLGVITCVNRVFCVVFAVGARNP